MFDLTTTPEYTQQNLRDIRGDDMKQFIKRYCGVALQHFHGKMFQAWNLRLLSCAHLSFSEILHQLHVADELCCR